MDQQASVLSGLGVVFLVLSFLLGDPLRGYWYGPAPAAMLLRYGVGFLALGVLTSRLRPLTVRRSILIAVSATVVVFAISVGLVVYELGFTPPRYGIPSPMARIRTDLFIYLLMTLPIPAGYLSGVLVSEGRPWYAVIVLSAALAVSWIGPAELLVARGSPPGFTHAFYAGATIVVAGVALLPLLVMGGLSPGRTTGE